MFARLRCPVAGRARPEVPRRRANAGSAERQCGAHGISLSGIDPVRRACGVPSASFVRRHGTQGKVGKEVEKCGSEVATEWRCKGR